MSGQEFATHVQAKFGVKFGVIKSNAEMSKHLETAAAKVNDVLIDFVQLRSEVYTTETRVPIIEGGTPEEDALRRDLTINALFYNIHTKKVEDLTGKGLNDLRDGIARTPLEPY